MPLQTEPALLTEQEVAGHDFQEHGAKSGGGNPICNILKGIMEVFGLFFTVPGFWRLCLLAWLTGAGTTLPTSVYINTFQSATWGCGGKPQPCEDHSASYGSYYNAAQFAVAIFGAPLFAAWSDRHDRKIAMLIGVSASWFRYIPFIFEGWLIKDPYVTMDVYIATVVVTASFVGQVSGSPVFWALMTDTLPQEHRETGFSLIFAVASLGTWATATIVNQIVQDNHLDPKVFYWVGMVFLTVQILVVATMPAKKPHAAMEDDEEDPDPLSRNKGLVGMLLSPLKLVARKRSLRLICGFAAFVTLPDVAVTYTAIQLVIPMQLPKFLDPADPLAISNMIQWFSNFPNIFLIALYVFVGLCSKRFGPARFLSVWTPITSILFAAPALLQWYTGKFWWCFTGVLMLSPVSIYPPLQAIVALLVPPSRVGEAMGAVSAFKNLASLIAPLSMGFITQVLADNNHTDYYWILFPASAAVMLAGAWPFSLLLARRVGHDTDVQWSVWSSVAGSRVGNSVRNSHLGSAAQEPPSSRNS